LIDKISHRFLLATKLLTGRPKITQHFQLRPSNLALHPNIKPGVNVIRLFTVVKSFVTLVPGGKDLWTNGLAYLDSSLLTKEKVQTSTPWACVIKRSMAVGCTIKLFTAAFYSLSK
jgi:hypothetical protein